ncbi:protein-glutamate O-methyltransferase CheR [Sphingomonas sp.]|jgi:chemotaxis protein methyltransferase CheR|uniref:CheR family methyltransferase n=1 Tax=Sphingomonas sp. TaxID=28214 RepID=UPI002D80908D|nr:protein-glutamate O-methyltransferase CheR [Sphingomonas sp.]HEU0043560.1 protein-glutamate O-methyltransferase CheR [Sphingomonas sp.]
MTPSHAPATVRYLTALLQARTGQELASYRSWRLDTALKPLLKARNLQTLDQLVALLHEGSDPRAGDQVVDALVNGETSFFRDAAVFDLILAAVGAVESTGRRPRIWCAGCATGQEPLSLAMLFAERVRDGGRAPMPEIVATDVSETAIARARSGRYTQFEVQRGLPIRRLMQWFDGDGTADWTAKSELVRHVQFRRANLVADPAPPGRFDLVLCRNVLLYLTPQAKQPVFDTLAGALRPEGLLVLGAGETVIGQTRVFEPSRTVRGLYAKAAATAKAAA